MAAWGSVTLTRSPEGQYIIYPTLAEICNIIFRTTIFIMFYKFNYFWSISNEKYLYLTLYLNLEYPVQLA